MTMTNNTIPNVPRELLERLRSYIPNGDGHNSQYANDLADAVVALEGFAAPSPAGVDGLEVVAWQHWGDRTKLLCALGKERGIPGSYTDEFTQPLCRLSDAQAIIDGLRGDVASLENQADEMNAALTDAYSEYTKQYERIGELEGLLRDCYPGCGLTARQTQSVRERIDAALSAGKEGE